MTARPMGTSHRGNRCRVNNHGALIRSRVRREEDCVVGVGAAFRPPELVRPRCWFEREDPLDFFATCLWSPMERSGTNPA